MASASCETSAFAPNTLSQSSIAVLCLRFDFVFVGRAFNREHCDSSGQEIQSIHTS